MKKLALSLAIISALGLSACDSETIEDVQKEVADNGTAVTSLARVVFDPGAATPRLSIPNDLLFSGTQDGTLNLPVADATDFSDPTVAMSALDGWSTTNPFVLAVDFPAGSSLDAVSVFDGNSVKIYETLMGGDAGCEAVPRGAACTVVGELVFGVDFVAQAKGNSIAIVPMKPLKGKTTYVVALTNNLKDNNGKSVAASITYDLVRQDIATKPLATASQLQLQGLVNSFENAIVSAGADKDSLIYTFAMTTQSTVDVLFTVKKLLAAPLAQGGMPPVVSVTDTMINVATALEMQGVVLSDNLKNLYSTAQLYSGSIKLPYYLGVPTQANPKAPITDWWKALCDSGVMLAGLAAANPGAIPEGPIAGSRSDAVCSAVGLRDLRPAGIELDVERNLTKFNPVPQPSGVSDIPGVTDPSILAVQMTTPVIAPLTDAVRASYGLPPLVAEPTDGWPVVILQHGITGTKEQMLAITGVLSTFGFATVAIDHPLHGSRGFDITGPNKVPDGIDDINASTVSATHYMNLASLLTTRDNLRQSASDMLGLRLGLNAVSGAKINGKNVHFLGHSLGAITGINLVALANAPLDSPLDPLDPMFKITSNSQAMPGVMIANFLMESGAFGDVIKSNLVYSSSAEFKGMVDAAYPLDENGNSTATEAQLVGAYQAFYAALTPEQQAGIEAVFSKFVFAAQTVTDAGDPANYASIIKATQTPTHLIEVVGNGADSNGVVCKDILDTDNCSDQVIPNTVTTTPFGGTEGAIALLGLPSVSSTTEGSGAVRFIYGHHGSILSPAPNSSSIQDPLVTGAATQEMQGQVAGFFATMGQLITVTNTDVVQ
ncbi:VolA/Pla-1 family phospholipase [Colwellia sp. Bg11-28]|uniref:VolA/Pla-1 family phospholipase n=1 Tax=Colwellia sp. Bg11-28 TaxID=2058305 RepID=UPI000C326720|nr:VolA/Pla-1 family phospholipase [Colwellia sp. Bg11-28]PKH89302.1 lipase [Colwellia sp. Bg11-28]